MRPLFAHSLYWALRCCHSEPACLPDELQCGVMTEQYHDINPSIRMRVCACASPIASAFADAPAVSVSLAAARCPQCFAMRGALASPIHRQGIPGSVCVHACVRITVHCCVHVWRARCARHAVAAGSRLVFFRRVVVHTQRHGGCTLDGDAAALLTRLCELTLRGLTLDFSECTLRLGSPFCGGSGGRIVSYALHSQPACARARRF